MTETLADWAQPHDVSDARAAFPASVGDLLPPYETIPTEFKSSKNTWVQFQQQWFFHGLAGAKARLRDGIDGDAAFRHLSAINASFEPKHEHKQAGVAYLASLWFVAVSADGKVFGDAPADAS